MNQITKVFTPAEANRMLPLVSRIVRDILADGRELYALEDVEDADVASDRLGHLLKDVNCCIHELRQLGCSFKEWDEQLGLVEFPARINGEDVLLCWRSDEEAVTHYHDLDGSYKRRQPIPENLLETAAEPTV